MMFGRTKSRRGDTNNKRSRLSRSNRWLTGTSAPSPAATVQAPRRKKLTRESLGSLGESFLLQSDILTLPSQRSGSSSSQLSVPQPGSFVTLNNSSTIERHTKYGSFFAHKFKFDSRLYGREAEKRILEDALESDGRELIIIKGASGTGKTALALSLKKLVYRKKCGAFILGKFNMEDQQTAGVPYSAIADVCSQICKIVSSRNDERIQNVCIREKLGTTAELQPLKELVPELEEETKDSPKASSAASSLHDTQGIDYIIGNEQSKARFLYAFRTFFRIVHQILHPLVVVLDDLQWADSASLELLENLINDVDNPTLCLACVYRSNEVDDTHALARLITRAEQQKDRLGPLNISYLTTTNLPVSVVHEMLTEVLGYDDDHSDDTLPLAELCFRRTLGNVFFLVTFIRRLWDDNLLPYNMATNRFTWDIDSIVEKTEAMTNVVGLMKHKMEQLPFFMQRRLCIAACFGNSFPAYTLNLMLEQMEKDLEKTVTNTAEEDEDPFSLQGWLSFAAQSGFIEQQTKCNQEKEYQWVHDTVREGALALLPPDELCMVKGKIGRWLAEMLWEEDSDSVVFVVANLLHEGPPISDKEDQIRLAQVDLYAAEKAEKVSAFTTAAEYAARGIDLLPEDRWNSHKSLTLDLLTMAARMEAMSGLTDLVEDRVQEVTVRNDIPLSSKLGSYSAKISILTTQFQMDDAAGIVLNILSQQGIKFPSTNLGRLLSTIKQLIGIKKKCEELTMDFLIRLPEMDSTGVGKLKLLNQLSVCCYSSLKLKPLLPLTILAAAKYTFTFGTSVFAPALLSSLGIVFSGVMHNYQLGGKMALLAMNLQHQREYKSTACFSTFQAYQFLRCWVDPISSCQPRLMRAYKLGLRGGDTDFACYSVWAAIIMGFQAGRSLELLERDCHIYAAQILELKRYHVLGLMKGIWLSLVQLMGKENTRKSLLGETEATMSLDELTELEKYSENMVSYVSTLKSRLYMFFGDHKAGAKLAIERGDKYSKQHPALQAIMPETFARGVSLYARAIKTKKAMYKKHAKKVHARIKMWRQKGNPNVIHYENILDAEAATMRGQFGKAESFYVSAKTIAARGGFIHDAALACERFGEMILIHRESPSEAVGVLEDAISLYTEWGAHAKADQLRQKHFSLWA